MLSNGKGEVVIENIKNPNVFIGYSQTIHDIYETLEDYNPTKKRRVLIVFNDIAADLESNQKLSPIVTELFLMRRKLNISLVFISRSYFKVRKTIRLNTTHDFNVNILNKSELQQVPPNHLCNIDLKELMKLDKYYTKALYSFLENNTILSSDHPLRFRMNLL